MHLSTPPSHLTITPAIRKKSKHDQFQINEQQEKISEMIHGFYDKLKSKITKSLTKYENKNAILCKELFQSLNLHPKQELYQTIKLHDIIFNEIQHLTQIAHDFIKKIDTLHEKITAEIVTQKQKNMIKKEKQKQGENTIAILRKVSFKRQKHNLNNRLISLDTINKKILKCQESNQQNGFYFDIEGKKTDVLIYNYQKIWFENKQREYLLCYGKDKDKNQFYIFNDKLQTISVFSNAQVQMNSYQRIIQINNLIYIITAHKIIRIDLLCQDSMLCRVYKQTIVGAQVLDGQIILWVVDGDKHHSILFVDQSVNIYDRAQLKLNVYTIARYFKLIVNQKETIYFITRTYSGSLELLKIDNNQAIPISSDLANLLQVITQRSQQEVIFRMTNNKFMVFNKKGFANLDVDIDKCESIKKCIVLGQHLYALSDNGKYMLECHYQSNLN